MEHAPELHPFTLRLGVVFALIGYGTKAGLAPMHTWKPDAYREAPSPAGVMMAVGMLNAALYCLLRVHLISKAALGPDFSGGLLLDARPAVGARGDALHPDPVESQAAAGVLQHRARRDHGRRDRSRRRSGRLRRAVAHDLSHVRQAGRVLLRGHAGATPPLVQLRGDRAGHAQPGTHHERAPAARGAVRHRVAALQPVLQRDDDSSRGVPGIACDRHLRLPCRARDSVLWVCLSDRRAGAWRAAAAPIGRAAIRKRSTGAWASRSSRRSSRSSRRSICPDR